MKEYPEIASDDTMKFYELEEGELFEFCCMSNPKGRELWEKISHNEAKSMYSDKRKEVDLGASVIKIKMVKVEIKK